MRNVTNFTETVTSYQSPLGVDSYVPVSTINATHRVGTSARDESVATSPNDEGAYFLPTAYRGWFYGSTSWPADYLAVPSSGTSFRRYWGRYTWSQYTNSAANVSTIYGCDASNRPSVPTGVISRVEASLNQQMLAQNWNIGTMLGELPETIGFILDCLKDLIAIAALVKGRFSKNAIFKFKPKRKKRINKYGPRRLEGGPRPKGDVFDLKRNRDGSWGYSPKRDRLRRYREAYLNLRNAKGASSAYLAFVYAVQPLLSDVYSSMRTLEEGVNQLRNKRFTVSADASEPIPAPFPRAGVTVVGSQGFTGEWGCKGFLAVKVKSPTLATLDSLGLLDPLSVAWELVPLSFVIDWFIPVGAFLRSLGGHWGLILSHGYRTDYAKWSADIEFITALRMKGGTPGRITGRCLSFDRKPYYTWPMPVPYITGIDLMQDYEKYISLLAIGFQRVFK